jgi:large subunit ribosomal protein LP2
MKYVAAYILLSLGGKKDVSEKDLTDFFKAAGVESDANQIKSVVDNLKGKNLNELATKGLPKLASLSFGSGASSAAAGPAKDDKKKEEPKKEEKKKEEPPAEEAVDVDLGDMFG